MKNFALIVSILSSLSCQKYSLDQENTDLSTVTFGKVNDDRFASLKLEVKEKDSKKLVLSETFEKGASSSKQFKKGWYIFSMIIFDKDNKVLYQSSDCSQENQEKNVKELKNSKENVIIKVCGTNKKEADQVETSEVDIDIDIIEADGEITGHGFIAPFKGVRKKNADPYLGKSLVLSDHKASIESESFNAEAKITKSTDQSLKNYKCSASWEVQVIDDLERTEVIIVSQNTFHQIPFKFNLVLDKSAIEQALGSDRTRSFSGGVELSLSCKTEEAQ